MDRQHDRLLPRLQSPKTVVAVVVPFARPLLLQRLDGTCLWPTVR